jgi:hypothetical protein
VYISALKQLRLDVVYTYTSYVCGSFSVFSFQGAILALGVTIALMLAITIVLLASAFALI